MGAELKDAGWVQRAGLRVLTNALGAENIRWVGGAIRDSLLGVEVNDVDCATTLLPDAVIDRCRDAGIRTVPTGIEHGTVTAILDDGPVEITTLRRDVSTDGRRATVAFASEWREDAARRDFTINALYAHPETLKISDYFGGRDDLKARRVRFIGDASERIREDHLRILRYFRFQARFGSQLDPDAEAACSDLASTLKGLSRERIASELLSILGLADPSDVVARMRKLGVLQVVLPEACPPGLKAIKQLVAEEAKAGIEPKPIRRLSALLPTHVETVEAVAARLRLSRAQRAQLVSLAERTPRDIEETRELAYYEGIEIARDRLLLQAGDLGPLIDWEVPRFPLKGGAIVASGVAAGPMVARLLRLIENRWVAEGFPQPDRIDEILQEELVKASPEA
jgi:poly(A) polymerase